MEAAVNLKFQEMPGTGFNYSSANTQLLSAILTKIVGEPLRGYTQPDLFPRWVFLPWIGIGARTIRDITWADGG